MKTNLDLALSAEKAVASLMKTDTAHGLLKAAMSFFESEGCHPADWTYWYSQFQARRNWNTGAAAQPSQGAIIAQKEAAEAAVKAAISAKTSAPVPVAPELPSPRPIADIAAELSPVTQTAQ